MELREWSRDLFLKWTDAVAKSQMCRLFGICYSVTYPQYSPPPKVSKDGEKRPNALPTGTCPSVSRQVIK